MMPHQESTAHLRAENCDAPLIIGIGSPHGDDRVGWEVIEQLQKQCPEQCAASLMLRKASVPHDILDWLCRDTKTHIIDACSTIEAGVCRYEVFRAEVDGSCISLANSQAPTKINVTFESLRSGSSHQLDLLTTLQLAAALGSLPLRLVLWTIPIVTTEKNADLNAATIGYVADCATRIRLELLNA